MPKEGLGKPLHPSQDADQPKSQKNLNGRDDYRNEVLEPERKQETAAQMGIRKSCSNWREDQR